MIDFDFLTDSGIKIIQAKDGYRMTSDAMELAKFVQCKASDIVIDAGCGNGVISLVVNDRCKPYKIIAVDIIESAAGLAKENVAINDIKNIEVHCADIRDFHKTYGANLADIVVCNPPYFSTGRRSSDPIKHTARHDDALSIQDLAMASTRLLKFGGALYLCYPGKYIAKAIYVLESQNFRIRTLQFLSNEKGVYLVLIHAKKGGGDGTVVMMR